MLLNYLYSNFYEEQAFLDVLGLSTNDWQTLLDQRVVPSASYLFTNSSLCVSFIKEFQERELYRFHLKTHQRWVEDVHRFDLTNEQRAKDYFCGRFETAKSIFFSGRLGAELNALYPEIAQQMDTAQLDAAWGHFLNGTYGICTRDGQPETIFLKQAGVRFIERMTQCSPEHMSAEQRSLLARVVDLLDTVESEFAPHEVASSSRQRCIIDVRERYLNVAMS
ncbi:DUF6058 family natural product biosynthesis protein [Pseudovibrio sp. Tun.PSC04-5.I4]|uniref:DUF6058 family natural product biosynthesis protein n=1 Tax=Pseudovibrio sp. Tun.PSC04-5.I4 TaxID=1798213 RepID=UPI000880606B|nr:DUF6058 family natural product biosynthesis protein [Pseudovibrio sp. Tun.PSC04-5.I4]SDQ86752.1 hypothetical protein SAMN04515695_1705 [Pseudovibrio sp. Tun.PSC04-5.I4]